MACLIGYLSVQTGDLMLILWEAVTYTMHCLAPFTLFYATSENTDVMMIL